MMLKTRPDIQRMHDLALTALGRDILVSDIFVPTSGDYDGQLAILKDDADTSKGTLQQQHKMELVPLVQ